MTSLNLRQRLEQALWRERDASTPRWRKIGLRFLRTMAVLARDNMRGDLTLRAMGLVYTTLLSLVPLLALSFSVLKAFGVHNQIRPFLEGVLAPLGENSDEITGRIVAFIENMNVGVLGSVGLALLLYTAVSLVQKIEEAFNFIWHITHARSFGERFSRYLTLLLVGPILVFSSMGLTASAMNAGIVQWLLDIEPFGRLYVALSQLMPYLLVIVAFSVAYFFIPNTRVRVPAALVGGAVAGIAWQSAGWLFAEFAATSGRYRAIYSGFAILILFMVWLYLSWRIVLFGASVSFYFQHPEYLIAGSGDPRLSNRMREHLALGLIAMLAGRFHSGMPPLPADELPHRLGVPSQALQEILDELESHGLLARVANGHAAYLPTRNLASLSLWQILQIVRSAGETGYLAPGDLPPQPAVAATVQRIEAALADALAELSAQDLAIRPSGDISSKLTT
jgi:membrane protein